jgi:hypothetical protein
VLSSVEEGRGSSSTASIHPLLWDQQQLSCTMFMRIHPPVRTPTPTPTWACMHHVHTKQVRAVWLAVRRPRAASLGGA